MIVELIGFKLIQDHGRFNIEKLKTKKKLGKDRKATGETYKEWENIAYGMTLENAIERIIMLRLEADESIVTLNKFLQAYKTESNNVKTLIKEQEE